MRVSEICVKQIRVNQGLGVYFLSRMLLCDKRQPKKGGFNTTPQSI